MQLLTLKIEGSNDMSNHKQSVIAPYQKTLSDEAVKFYERTGLSCYEWQKNLLDPIMAGDEDGLWVHQKFGYVIPRRNGKTEVIYIKKI